MYVLMPGESKQVEAASDPIGLKIGIVYDAAPEGQILMYQMWKVKNESVLTITYVNGGDISTFGGKSLDKKQYCLINLPYKLCSENSLLQYRILNKYALTPLSLA